MGSLMIDLYPGVSLLGACIRYIEIDINAIQLSAEQKSVAARTRSFFVYTLFSFMPMLVRLK